jgi:capsular polysaccharide biosynthesis protein
VGARQRLPIVAVHGAGLANIIFTPPGAAVVILDYKRYVEAGHTRMFVVLAEMMGHRPFVIACDEKVDGRADEQAHHRDVVVNAAELDNVLARIAFSRR